MRQVRGPDAAEMTEAARVVRAQLAPTPLVPVRLPADGGAGGRTTAPAVEAVVKLETAQPTGSFKVRGALAAIDAYTRGGAKQVVTASAGNHGLGVAWAAGRLGVAATIVVPTTASPAKVEALAAMDVELVQHGDDYDAAERHALGLAGEGQAVFVSAYNDAYVIAGQATMAAEVVEQVGDEVTLVVPVGGGGLLAGAALVAAEHPGVRVVPVEAVNSPAVSGAVAAGRVVPVTVRPTLADGLAGNIEPGSVTPALAGPHIEAFVPVDERRIADAMRTLATRAGLVAEGAAAVGVAALTAGEVPTDRPVVIVLTGRNVAPALLAGLLTKEAP